MATRPYPTDFPLEEVTSVLSIVRGGTVKTQAPTLVKDLWWLAGYAAKQAFGDPDVAAAATITKSAAFDPLATLDAVQALGSGKPGAQTAIDWASLLVWAIEEIAKVLATTAAA